jgi:hypothetical protein
MSLNYRSMFARLAKKLIEEDKREEALKTLDRCLEVIPHESIPYNFSMIGAVEAYMELGEHEKAIGISETLGDLVASQVRYFAQFDNKQVKFLDNDPRIAMSVIQKLALTARLNAPSPDVDVDSLSAEEKAIHEMRVAHFDTMDALFTEVRDIYYDSALANLQ